MKIYLAGPMRGVAGFNRELFLATTEWLEKRGHRVFHTATVAKALGIGERDPVEACTDEGMARLRHAAAVDFAQLSNCDAIALLPGWERSRGATMELAIAQFLGLKILDGDSLETISPRQTPWAAIVSNDGDGDWSEVWRGVDLRLQQRAAQDKRAV